MKTISICFLFVTLLVSSYAAPGSLKPKAQIPPNSRIIGGSDATRNEFPYQISYQQGVLGIVFSHICGGSIISENWVVLAAHCITANANLRNFRIVAGILNIDDGDSVATREVRSITRQIIHAQFEGGVGPYDIGLAEVATPFTFNDGVQPISLPPAGYEATGRSTLTGWGSTGGIIVPTMPNTLQKLDATIVENDECKAALDSLIGGDNPFAPFSNLCSGPLNGGTSACNGDSGGPLAQDNVLIGIVSWGIVPCGSTGAPSVYTKVSNYLDWIEENTGVKSV